ncbi:MAG: penicillin-binding protein, partial [Salegentibacter sp.]
DDQRIGFRNTAIGQGANSALPIFGKFVQKLNHESEFSKITRAHFAPVSAEVASLMDCDDSKKDSFLKRLFTNPDKTKKYDKKEEKKKKGFFQRLFGKKNKKGQK